MSRARKEVRNVESCYDFGLLMLIIFISVFGLIMIYSTSAYNAAKYYNDAKLYLRKQGYALIAGTVGMIIVSNIDYHFYFKDFARIGRMKINLTLVFYVLCAGLCIFVLFSGYSAGGSSRWIDLGHGVKFQPSEFAKVAVILMTSYMICLRPKDVNTAKGVFRIFFYVFALLIAPVAVENLSTALVMGAIMVAICISGSRGIKQYLPAMAVILVLGTVFVLVRGYRMERITSFFDSENAGYQIGQGLYAIASGGIFGKGIGGSMQKLGYIPEAHTDMIFAVIVEELGIVGAMLVILAFGFIIWRMYTVAANAPDLLGSLICVGVLVHIALQVILNVAVVTNTMPATGVPLPFISYGGSSLCVFMAEVGFVLSVSKYTYRDM